MVFGLSVVVAAATCVFVGSVRKRVSLAPESSQSSERSIVPGATTLIVCVLNFVPDVDTVPLKVVVTVAVSALGADASAPRATSITAARQRTPRRRARRFWERVGTAERPPTRRSLVLGGSRAAAHTTSVRAVRNRRQTRRAPSGGRTVGPRYAAARPRRRASVRS